MRSLTNYGVHPKDVVKDHTPVRATDNQTKSDTKRPDFYY